MIKNNNMDLAYFDNYYFERGELFVMGIGITNEYIAPQDIMSICYCFN